VWGNDYNIVSQNIQPPLVVEMLSREDHVRRLPGSLFMETLHPVFTRASNTLLE
jgi:hypothetical protein